MTDEDPLTPGASERVRRGGYAFGDIEYAADRLQLLDRVFTQPSQWLVDMAVGDVIELAVDLGCGPGFTTQRLAERLRPRRLVGMDTSDSFLSRAASAVSAVEWLHHDVTKVPFPTGPADVLHARFVLSHLPEPESVLVSWVGQLKPSGFLLVLEDDAIESNDPVLSTYEEMARALVAHRGGELWVGTRLSRVALPTSCETVVNRAHAHPVPISLAAQMFSMNFAVWRNDPFISETYPAEVLEDLGIELARIARGGHAGEDGRVLFHLRQLAIRRNL